MNNEAWMKEKEPRLPAGRQGFTIIELLVSVAIFIIMTSLVVAKYGNFNQSTLLTDTAYDIALTLRTAQNYGISVKNSGTFGATVNFAAPYGIDFNTDPTGNTCANGNSNAKQIVLFADTYPTGSAPGNGVYDAPTNCDTPVTLYALTRGAKISGICAGSGLICDGTTATQLDVTFRRPNPDAVICINGSCSNTCSLGLTCTYAEVTLQATDGSTRVITVRKNGQVSVNK